MYLVDAEMPRKIHLRGLQCANTGVTWKFLKSHVIYQVSYTSGKVQGPLKLVT